MCPWVDMNSPFASQLADALAVDNAELEPEFVTHFLLPLNLQGRGTEDERRPNAMPKHHFLHHQSGLDCLAEPDIVRDEQIHPRHRKCPNNRIELIFIDLDAAPERRLKRTVVSLRDGAPLHGI